MPPVGYKHSEETRAKISNSSMGKPGTYGHTGRKHSDEARAKMSAMRKGKPPWNKGKNASEEQRARMSEAKVGKALDPAHRSKIGEGSRTRSGPAALADPEKRRKLAWRAQREYGIQIEEVEKMNKAQKGCCALCPDEWQTIDHDHRTMRVRGLLCDRCNRRVGHLEASPEWTEKALKYLEVC